MKVKIFSGPDNPESTQEVINNWIEDNSPNIRFIEQSEAYGSDQSYSFSISIWYEEE